MTVVSRGMCSAHPLTGTVFSNNTEIMQEIAEAISNEVGDIRYGSLVLDTARHQMTGTLEDGRKIRITVVFTA